MGFSYRSPGLKIGNTTIRKNKDGSVSVTTRSKHVTSTYNTKRGKTTTLKTPIKGLSYKIKSK